MLRSKKTYRIPDVLLCVFKYIPYHVVALLLFMLWTALLPAFQTLAVASFVDNVTAYLAGNLALRGVFLALFCVLFFQFCIIILPALNRILEETGRNKMGLKLQIELLHKRACLEYHYVEEKESWDLVERITKDPSSQFISVFFNAMNLVSLSVTVFSILLIIMRTAPIAGIAIIVVAIPFCGLATRSGKENYGLAREGQKIQRRYQYLEDILIGRDTVEERNLFSYSNAVGKEYDRLCRKSFQIEKKIQRKSFINLKSGSVVTVILAILIIAFLFPSFYEGKLSLGLMIGLVTAIWNLVQSMSWQLSEMMFAFAQSSEFCKELTEFMAMDEKSGACVLPALRNQIKIDSVEFRDVSFCYPGTQNYVLHNCSFLLERGKSYAFVGENGAGKTTIVKLLLGLYEEYEGKILLNGIDVKEYPYEELKSFFAVLSQDFVRYELSIQENVFLGDVNVKDENRMYDALIKSGLEEMISGFPDGVSTELGHLKENGTDLSGGQWQRLAIARLLYADAQINVLDEPTSALDPMQESKIYNLFHEVRGDCLTIYITHRLGAARIADKIFVLKDGLIKEAGVHEELVQLENGFYREMYESQRAWYE